MVNKTSMKVKIIPLFDSAVLGLLWLFCLPAISNAGFTFVTNNNTITITSYSGADDPLIIPSTTNGLPVSSIGDSAFTSSSTTITNVIIPNSITNIGISAFDGCENLVSLTIPNSVLTIGDNAFIGCSSLTSLSIPHNVRSIGDNAFNSCSSLTNVSIDGTISGIGAGTFDYCFELAIVSIPRSVTNIDSEAFGYCAFFSGSLSLYFQGDAPAVDSLAFNEVDTNTAAVYYLPGTSNWGAKLGGISTILWNPHIQQVSGLPISATNPFNFNILGTTDIPFVMQACTNLSNASWKTLLSGTLTNGSIYFSDSPSTNCATRFYRFTSPQ